jgi:hypothetical protein
VCKEYSKKNIEKLIFLGTAYFGMLLVLNVKGKELKQDLLEEVKNVLEKESLNIRAKTTV